MRRPRSKPARAAREVQLPSLARIRGGADSVLNDPSLTVEDKVTLLIMMIQKQADPPVE
jgi:hypothetical protein